MSTIIRNKKTILIILGIVTLPFTIPLIQMIGTIIFEGGRLIGNLIRVYSSSCI